MLIIFDCPKCLKISRGGVTSASHDTKCSACDWTRPLQPDDLKGESPNRCLVCGCSDLWRQKNFDQRLGVIIVGLGALVSTIFLAYWMPGASIMALMAVGLLDWILYAILPDRLVCYRCHAQYRQVPNLAEIAAFDLEVNERYRQEAIRLKQAEK